MKIINASPTASNIGENAANYYSNPAKGKININVKGSTAVIVVDVLFTAVNLLVFHKELANALKRFNVLLKKI